MLLAIPTNFRIYRLAIGAFFFISGLTFATWASRIPDVKEMLQLSNAGLGAVLFSLPIGQLVGLPISALLIKRYGSKAVVIISAIMYPFILLMLSWCTTVWQLVTVLMAFGFAANLLNIAMNTQAIGVEKHYGRPIMSSFHGVWSIAGFSGALVGGFFVAKGFSPAIHFSFICFSSALLAIVSYKHTLIEEPETINTSKVRKRLDGQIILLGSIAFCCMLCEGAMADWSGVYFQKVVQVSDSYKVVGYVAFTFTMATGRFFGDKLSTKYGFITLLKSSGLMIFIGLMIAVIAPGFMAATAGFLLVGFGVSSVVPIVYSLAGRSTTMQPSAALAAVSTISFLGFLVGPPIIGFIAEFSNLQVSFAVVAVLSFGITLLAGRLKQI